MNLDKNLQKAIKSEWQQKISLKLLLLYISKIAKAKLTNLEKFKIFLALGRYFSQLKAWAKDCGANEGIQYKN
jgi:hypothetical protein